MKKIIFLILIPFLFINNVKADMYIKQDCAFNNETCYNTCVEEYKNGPINMNDFCNERCCILKDDHISIMVIITIFICLILLGYLIKLRYRKNDK